MDRYMSELKSYLNQLSDSELDEVTSFYSEYLQDGGFDSYAASVAELGSPRQLARKVLADYSIRLLDSPKSEGKSMGSRVNQSQTQVRTIWLIVLAILSTPLTIPLGIAVIATLFAMFAGGAAIIFALVITVAAVFIAGIAMFGVGLAIVFKAFSTGILYLGAGLLVIGAFIMLIPVFNWLIRGIIHITLTFSQWLYGKLSRKNRAEERRDKK